MTLSDPVFRSKLRDDLEAFISQKRASGYPYHTSSKVLGYLDTSGSIKIVQSKDAMQT